MKRILSYLSIAVLTVAGISCNKNLEPASIVLNHEVLNVAVGGERTTIGVKSNRDWVATVDKDWLTLTPASAEAFEASSYMILDVEPNDDIVREAIITVAAKSGEFTATMKVIQGEDGLVIKTADQFVAFMQLAASGTLTDNYRISRDIDLDGVTLPVVPELSVSLDGQGCSILGWTSSAPMFETISAKGSVSNLVLDASCTLTLPETYGHFGFITNSNSGTITGIENFADITMTALPSQLPGDETTAYVGSICGDSNGYIADCSNYGNITYAGGIGTKNAYVGAVVGRVNSASALADNLYNIGDVTATFNDETTTSYYFTGLVGTVASNGKLLNSTNDGNVTVKAHGNKNMMVASGVTAYAGGQVAGCTNKGNITYIAETAEGLADGGVQRTGVCGIAAYMGWSGQTVDNNHNEGDITFRAGYCSGAAKCGSFTNYGVNVAGLYGAIYNCAVTDCTNTGNISFTMADLDNSGTYSVNTYRMSCGGVISSSWGKIENCENSGDIDIVFTTEVPQSGVTLAGWNGKVVGFQFGGISGGDYQATGQDKSPISGCINNGDIHIVTNTTNYNNNAGGIVGWPTKGGATIDIADCVNNGDITVEGSSLIRLGGIAGVSAMLKYCTNDGDIYLKGAHANSVLGGIVGYVDVGDAVTSCVSTGAIMSDVKLAGTQGDFKGGIGGVFGAAGNNNGICIDGNYVNADITAPAGSTAWLVAGVVGQNKNTTNKITFGTTENPTVIGGGSLTLGTTTTAVTASNYNTLALPWDTNKTVSENGMSNSNISYVVNFAE